MLRGNDEPSETQDGSRDQPLESGELDILDQIAKPETPASDAGSKDNGQVQEQQSDSVDVKAIEERIRRELQSQHDKELAAQQKAALAALKKQEADAKAQQEADAQEAADALLDNEDYGNIIRQRKAEAAEKAKQAKAQQEAIQAQREALVQESNEALRNAEYAALPKEAWPLLQKAEAECHTPAEFVAAARKVHVDHLLAKERAKQQALDTDVSIRDTTASQAEIAAPVTSTGIPRTSTRIMTEDDYLNEGVAEMRVAARKK